MTYRRTVGVLFGVILVSCLFLGAAILKMQHDIDEAHERILCLRGGGLIDIDGGCVINPTLAKDGR